MCRPHPVNVCGAFKCAGEQDAPAASKHKVYLDNDSVQNERKSVGQIGGVSSTTLSYCCPRTVREDFF